MKTKNVLQHVNSGQYVKNIKDIKTLPYFNNVKELKYTAQLSNAMMFDEYQIDVLASNVDLSGHKIIEIIV